MALPIKPTPQLEDDDAIVFEQRAIENENKKHSNPNFEEEITLFYDVLKNSSEDFDC